MSSTPNQSPYDLLQQAIQLTPKNQNGGRSCAATIGQLAKLIPLSDEKERLAKAKAMFDYFCEDGTTPATGYLTFPGQEPYPYEPNRIVVGNDGTYMRLQEATLEYMEADADRAQRLAERARKRAEHWTRSASAEFN
jgi:hypothetical protein